MIQVNHKFVGKVAHHGLAHSHEVAPAIVLEIMHMNVYTMILLGSALILVFSIQAAFTGE